MTHVAAAEPAGRPVSATVRVLLGITAVVVLRFIFKYAVPYFGLDQAQFGEAFWSRRFGLLAHLSGGGVALLIGPVQLWLGETRHRMPWHRTLGKVYLGAVTVGCLGGYYLALSTTQIGWVYSSGLFGLAVAWTITTGMAYVAIRHRAISQHREWMIRSYVVTMAFVFYRLADELMNRFTATDLLERQKAIAWLCWAVPLLLAEPFIQMRKIGGRRVKELPDITKFL